MKDGSSGGVQQWVIGLASALSKLIDGPEEYLFLANPGDEGWLTPYLAGPCRLLERPAAVPGPVERPAIPGRIRRIRRWVRKRVPLLRKRRRRDSGERPRGLSPLHRTIVDAGADVMHFTMQSAFATTVPSIYQPWDLQHLHLPEFFSPEDRATRDVAYRAFSNQATLIVVATKWVKADVAAQFGIAPDRIAVVNPPPVTAAYSPPTAEESAAIADRLGLPERYAFYPAVTWGHKNHERLFEALAALRARGVVIALVCTGQQTERFAGLMERAAELQVDQQIRFLGYLSPAEIQVVYRHATVLVFPSLYEGWGLPILEAFASDLAVACSNATSLPELVGDAAVVFDPYDTDAIAAAVEQLWTAPGLRADLAERGRRRMRQFNWDSTALTMRAHYRRVAGQPLDRADADRVAAVPLV